MSHASNVSGTVLDAETAGKICKQKGVYFALDAAQSAGVIDIDFEKFSLSALCITGHKGLLGPQGIGALLLTPKIAAEMEPLICGGTGSASHLITMPEFMPDKFEERTPAEIRKHELELAAKFIDGLQSDTNIRIVGIRGRENRVGTVSLDFLEEDNADIAYRLDAEYGIMTRCGLHCAPLAHQTFGTFPQGTVRFAFGYQNTREDVNYALKAIHEMVRK